jgi:hypothetical protein
MGILDAPAAKRPRTRRSIVSISAPNATRTLSSTLDLTQRTMFAVPADVVRYRFCFANQNLLAPGSLTSPVTISGIWAGTPSIPTTISDADSNGTENRWRGDFTAAPTQVVASSFSVPTDGSTVKTAWITTPAIAKGQLAAFSWGLTATAGTIAGGTSGGSIQGISATGAANASATTLTTPTISPYALYTAVWVEVETLSGAQIVLAITDSIGVGYTTDGPGGFNPRTAGCMPHENWPVISGLLGGYMVSHLGVASATPASYGTTSNLIWQRHDFSATVPDVAIISVGTNGLGADATTQKQNITTLIANLRTLGVGKILITPVLPRGDFAANYGLLQADVAAGATSITCPYNPGNTTIMIGNGSNLERVVVSAVSGTGPYTLTTAALVNAHTAGEPISSSSERGRRSLNNWIRQMPLGVFGLIDHSRMVESSADAPTLDSRWASTDKLHLLRPAQAYIGQQVATMGIGYLP